MQWFLQVLVSSMLAENTTHRPMLSGLLAAVMEVDTAWAVAALAELAVTDRDLTMHLLDSAGARSYSVLERITECMGRQQQQHHQQQQGHLQVQSQRQHQYQPTGQQATQQTNRMRQLPEGCQPAGGMGTMEC